MNNQGLEALAELAAASPASTENSGNNRSGVQMSGSQSGSRTNTEPKIDLSALQGLNGIQLNQILQLAASGNANNNAANQALLASLQQHMTQQQKQQQAPAVQAPPPVKPTMPAGLDGSNNQGMAYLQYLMQMQMGNNNNNSNNNMNNNNKNTGNMSYNSQPAVAPSNGNNQIALALQQLQSSLQKQPDIGNISNSTRQVLPPNNTTTTTTVTNSNNNSSRGPSNKIGGGNDGKHGTSTMALKSMPPPTVVQPVSIPTAQPNVMSGLSMHSATIAPQPSVSPKDFDMLDDGYEYDPEDKKQLKRAANRRSAQLSRKRKKQFIEELKEENDELRRKELILRSIPDLVVVFDSAGKLCFVSQSVSRFLQFSASELVGTSFWSRICDDSVRLLKAAFMDSLAARQATSETAPLGSGFWELRLVDKDGSTRLVTLNGVVHFAGERPECICSIRPCDGTSQEYGLEDDKAARTVVTNSTGSSSNMDKSKRQVSSNSGSESSDNDAKKHKKNGSDKKGRETFRVSDSNSSNGSESTCNSGDEETTEAL